MAGSKSLGTDDSSGFAFAQEMLDGDVTAAINFDRIQRNSETGEYVIFEYLLCDEKQNVNPHTSHPNRYWYKNSQKFISLFEVAEKLDATLYLVNYAKAGTRHEDKILLMRVEDLAEDNSGIVTENFPTDREKFKAWFRKQNAKCL